MISPKCADKIAFAILSTFIAITDSKIELNVVSASLVVMRPKPKLPLHTLN